MKYRADIDGLRAVSVLSVMVYHANISFGGIKVAAGGFLGVDVFFVISGYLISRILIEEIDGNIFSFRGFYIRRARRILPALAVVLAFCLVAGFWILTPDFFLQLAWSAVYAMVFSANYYFFSTAGYFSEASENLPLLHLWSLAVEEQFYVVYPLLFAFACRRIMRQWFINLLLVCCMLGFIASFLSLGRWPAAVFYLPWFRAWEMLSGALVAVWLSRNANSPSFPVLGYAGLGMVLLSVTLPPLAGSFSYLGNFLAVGGAAFLIAFGQNVRGVQALLSNRILVAIGLISYSLYLWHQPVFAFYRVYTISEFTTLIKISLLVITFCLAFLSWRFVELPFRDAARFPPPRFATAIAAMFLAIVCGCVATIVTNGFPQRFTQFQRDLLSVIAERGTLVLKDQNCQTASLERICIIGDGAQRPTWALLGDSHAETLADSLSALLKSRGVAGEVLTAPGCPFILGVDPADNSVACAAFTAAVFNELKKKRISDVVISDRSTAYILGTRFNNLEGGVESGDPFPVGLVGSPTDGQERIDAVVAQLETTIDVLLRHKIRVHYIAPIPEVGWHVPRTIVKLVGRGQLSLTTSRELYLSRHNRVLAMLRGLENRDGFSVVYPHQLFCDEKTGRCRANSGGRLFYTDTDHLSREGAAIVIDALAAKLQTAKSK